MALKNLFGFFPGLLKKQKKTAQQDFLEKIQLVVKMLPQIKEIMKAGNNATIDDETIGHGRLLGRMYDFALSYDQVTIDANGFEPIAIVQGNGGDLMSGAEDEKYEDGNKREAKKPVDVQDELERVPLPFKENDELIDEKINLLKDKNRISNQRYVKAQLNGIIKRLENRKKYKEFSEFFGLFPNTTGEKIDSLLAKYKLVMKESELFIPAFPKEAIDVMKSYTEQTEKLCGESPVFYVIAEEEDFSNKVKSLDPILLVQSPFGFYWQILGAWDKEMILLSEL